ncbi:hypothetical protein SCG7086_AZ_00020 [Chlamydiales bacterium SCGC AG-110-P3]|nr:hypothetical protein SCG7086_AZ_00020 [Chlamydiales bacterium SCGC AG-110-P3]
MEPVDGNSKDKKTRKKKRIRKKKFRGMGGDNWMKM